MVEGDKVLYIYNKPHDDKKLLNGARGVFLNFFLGYAKCRFTPRNTEYNFVFYVPPNHIRKLKQSELS